MPLVSCHSMSFPRASRVEKPGAREAKKRSDGQAAPPVPRVRHRGWPESREGCRSGCHAAGAAVVVCRDASRRGRHGLSGAADGGVIAVARALAGSPSCTAHRLRRRVARLHLYHAHKLLTTKGDDVERDRRPNTAGAGAAAHASTTASAAGRVGLGRAVSWLCRAAQAGGGISQGLLSAVIMLLIR